MNIWSLPPMRQTAERILIEASFLRLEDPTLTPLERLQAARARCVPEVLEAIVAIVKAQELAHNGAWTSTPVSRPSGLPWMATYHRRRKHAAEDRRARIRAAAAEHPDWSPQEPADHIGVVRSTSTVRCAPADRAVDHADSPSEVGQRGIVRRFNT